MRFAIFAAVGNSGAHHPCSWGCPVEGSGAATRMVATQRGRWLDSRQRHATRHPPRRSTNTGRRKSQRREGRRRRTWACCTPARHRLTRRKEHRKSARLCNRTLSALTSIWRTPHAGATTAGDCPQERAYPPANSADLHHVRGSCSGKRYADAVASFGRRRAPESRERKRWCVRGGAEQCGQSCCAPQC